MKNTTPQFDRNRHGGLYDRGSADSHYNRPVSPHWYPDGTYKGDAITSLTKKEIDEYTAGYDENEKSGSKKDYGY